nr:MAG TPA: tail assembly chaperone protein [Caudoviricetes sp.]
MDEERSLSAFLKENAKDKLPVFYVASTRYTGEDGEPELWELRCLTNDEVEELTKKNTKNIPVKGTREVNKIFNREQFAIDMTLRSVMHPNLHAEVLQSSYGVVGAEALLKTMLTPGELTDLILAVNEANDFKAGMDDKIKKAKN